MLTSPLYMMFFRWKERFVFGISSIWEISPATKPSGAYLTNNRKMESRTSEARTSKIVVAVLIFIVLLFNTN